METTLDLKPKRVPIVCIGASAGGLEALEKFFRSTDNSSGAAYVVIQHLSTDYKSVMDDLLSRYTDMPVKMAQHEAQLEADVVYLIPAGKLMELEDEKFKLYERDPRHLSLPIDIFLSSLASNKRDNTYAVILSGTGSDGTRGCSEINSVGGLVYVQQPDESKFDGMPRSAISAGVADFILSANEIPGAIYESINSPIQEQDRPSRNHRQLNKTEFKDAFDGILNLLRGEFSIDFANYKAATITRRIERRMQINNTSDLQHYLDLLIEKPNELISLRRELLIPVTSFFRDRETFDYLEKRLIPQIVKQADDQVGIRVWVAGCSTGEEAYSLCILFREAFQRQNRFLPLKIFATDVNPEVIEFASAGKYPESILAEMSKQRIARYFEKIDNQYTVTAELRQSIVFARHNLINDAPFTKMNLVSCRNTLIYFNQDAQRVVLKKLQYATNHLGYLLLGSSESLGTTEKTFAVEHTKFKIFQRKYPHVYSELKDSISHNLIPSQQHVKKHKIKSISYRSVSTIEDIQLDLMKEFTPPTLVVNEENTVVHTFGDTRPFVAIKEGKVSLQINRILPEKLVPIVFSLISRAKKSDTSVESDSVSVELENKEVVRLKLRVVSKASRLNDYLFVISIIKEKNQRETRVVAIDTIEKDTLEKIRSLESELSATRESLQSTIEELETTNEELQATNEELMASNEELQSSNEELQSVNEELNTVNSEYQEKLMILNRINADLENLSKSIGIPTIFLDSNHNITRFTPETVKLFKVRESDIGRPIYEIVHTLSDLDIKKALNTCHREKGLVEFECYTDSGYAYLCRFRPYYSGPENFQGYIITLIDIEAVKTSADLKVILDFLPEHIAVLNKHGDILFVNKNWDLFAQENGIEKLQSVSIGANYLAVCKDIGSKDHPDNLYSALKEILEGQRKSFSTTYPCHSAKGKRWFGLSAVALEGHYSYAAVISHLDVTEWYNND